MTGLETYNMVCPMKGGVLMSESELMLATIYVVPQNYCGLYSPSDALKYGTVFPCLNQPYLKNVK